MSTLLIHVENIEGGARETRAFEPGVVRVGRNRLNDLVLPHPAISQFHAHVEFDGARAALVAGRATNGVLCDGASVAPDARVSLTRESAVTLGPITLRFETSEVAVEGPDALPAWFADRFGWEQGRRGDDRAATDAYRPSALRSYLDAMLPGRVAGMSQPNADPLAPVLAQWNAATEALVDAVRAKLDATPAEGRAAALHALGVQHPPLRAAPGFQALAQALGVRWDEDLAELALLRWRQLAFQYGATPPSTAPELDEVVVRMVRGLTALAEGYAALRAAFEPWALAASARAGADPFAAQGDSSSVIAWLMGDERPAEKPRALRLAFAELATRPALLAGAAVQGVRALMDRWSPFAMEREMAGLRGLPALDAEGTAAVWAHWREVFRWWAMNERALHEAVFGEAFSHALSRDAGARWEPPAG